MQTNVVQKEQPEFAFIFLKLISKEPYFEAI